MIRAGIRRFFHLALRRRDRWEAEVEDEIKLHLALRAEELVARGHAPNDAYAEAVRRFGSLSESRARLLEAARHREQRMQRTEYLADLRTDIGFALRILRRQKSWTAVTIGTLALGIGATTAVFSVVSTMLLHPLPYPGANRIVYVYQQPSGGNHTGINVTISPSAPVVRAWLSAARSVEAMVGTQESPRLLKTVNGEPSRVNTASVFPSFPQFAGVHPTIGRMFTNADIENNGNVALVGESFWKNRLGASRAVLGQQLTLNDTAYTIIGVMPAALTFGTTRTRVPDVWLPLDIRNDNARIGVMARLRPGVSTASASAELDSIFARSSGFSHGKIPFHTTIRTPAQSVSFHDSLVMLAGAVALVLLVACANVAHLLLARSTTRHRELAIRSALGAGGQRLLRQLLTESLLLTFAASVAGVFVGWIGLRALIALRPQALDSLAGAHLDLTTLAAAAAVAIASGVGFTLLGAVNGARHGTYDALKQGAPSAGTSRRRGYGRSLLVVSEMALSAVLLVGATLLIRSVIRLQHADLGFNPQRLYSQPVPLDAPRFDAPETRAEVMRELMPRVRALPGVEAASLAAVEPGSFWFSVGRLDIEGEPTPLKSSAAFIAVNTVKPDYFRTMDIKLLNGTTFTDTSETSQEIIVNSGFARKHWPGESALGHRLRIAQKDTEPWLTIVGVADDAQTGGAIGEATAPMFYTPMRGVSSAPRIMIRATSATAIVPLAAMLKEMGVAHARPPESATDVLARAVAGPRFVMTLLTVFTAAALLLAAVGLYGTMAYTVAQRTREIGIRVALGASAPRIARSVVGRGVLLAGLGAAVGLFAAAWGTRLLVHQLYGIERLDPASFAIGGCLLMLTALIACVVPTRRALAVDPVSAIRAE
jgi:putative ABC transport system permease protein